MPEPVVFEDAGWKDLLPLTYGRAVFELRCGPATLLEKIEARCGVRAAVIVRPALGDVVSARSARALSPPDSRQARLLINGRLLLRAPIHLPPGSAAWRNETLLAAHVAPEMAATLTADVLLNHGRCRAALGALPQHALPADAYRLIDHPWQLVLENAAELRDELGGRAMQRAGRIGPGAQLVNPSAIHVARTATIKANVVLDAEAGPIWIDEGATISPNSTVQGPAYVGPNSLVQPNSILREATTIGPWCKVGGEIEGTIFQGYANKQHHGFLGHAFVGEWVNLGAGTVNSDLKNTYGPVRVAINGRPIDTGQTFVGSFIGDYAKTGINVALPTGAVIGFAANVFLSRHPPKFVPSFAWLTDDESARYDPARALDVARKVMARRKITMSPAEERLFLSIATLAPTIESSG